MFGGFVNTYKSEKMKAERERLSFFAYVKKNKVFKLNLNIYSFQSSQIILKRGKLYSFSLEFQYRFVSYIFSLTFHIFYSNILKDYKIICMRSSCDSEDRLNHIYRLHTIKRFRIRC
jgi:hypothetical protein